MNAIEAIACRHSTRAYLPLPLEEEKLQVILSAGCAAPVGSARYDALHLTVVQDESLLARIFDAVGDMTEKILGVRKDMNFGAKTLILVSAAPGMMPGIEYANAGCVLENMAIAATALGVASVIVGGPAAAIANDVELCATLCLPEGFKPLLGAFFGYAEEDVPAKSHTISITRK